jgi:hypothetical protein
MTCAGLKRKMKKKEKSRGQIKHTFVWEKKEHHFLKDSQV